MAERILIIDDDVDTLKLVGMMLQKQGYQIIAAENGEKGIERAEAECPDLILLDVMMPDLDGFEVAKRFRANSRTTNIPILMFTAKSQLDDKVTGFEAGADDYMTKPTHPSELSAHVKALLARSIKSKPSNPLMVVEKPAWTIGIVAPRGGQGVTTVAANLGDALRALTKGDVIVAELRPGMGTLGPDLGEDNPTYMADLLAANDSTITSQKIKEHLHTTPSGLRLLFGSIHAKDGLLNNAPEIMEGLVNRMRYMSSYLVVDLGAGLNALNQRLFGICNTLLVLVEPVKNSIMHTRTLINELGDLPVNMDQIHAVMVNRIRSDTQINMTQLEELLGMTPIIAITPAPELVYEANHSKTTMFSTRPNSLTAQQFSKLAGALLEFEKQIKK